MAKDKALTGAAGEYYVAFRLAAEGYAVGLTPRGTTSIDLIVANPETLKSVTIQTKTMFKDAFVLWKDGTYLWKWQVGVKTLRRPVHKAFFYVFVDLKGNPSQTPDVFIVPSDQLMSLTKDEEYKDKSGRVIDIWCVIYEKDAEKYRDRWDVIKNALA